MEDFSGSHGPTWIRSRPCSESRGHELGWFHRNNNSYGFNSPQSRAPRASADPAQETPGPDAEA
jgi:hypothetical protein